jgi:hypothetical protein
MIRAPAKPFHRYRTYLRPAPGRSSFCQARWEVTTRLILDSRANATSEDPAWLWRALGGAEQPSVGTVMNLIVTYPIFRPVHLVAWTNRASYTAERVLT